MSKKSIVLLVIAFFTSLSGFAQSDTLHLYYLGLATKMSDTTEAKVEKWAKKLKGKHADVDVICYYSQSDFKKYAVERSEDLFLVLNRKARDFITIKSNGARKGSKSQRSTVDVVYTISGAEHQSNQSAVSNEKSEKKTESTEKKTETGGTSEQKSSSTRKTESSGGSTSNSAETRTYDQNGYYLDSVYVNGVLKVTKRKIKKK